MSDRRILLRQNLSHGGHLCFGECLQNLALSSGCDAAAFSTEFAECIYFADNVLNLGSLSHACYFCHWFSLSYRICAIY